jgi:DNA-binding beta-propeller fold protein YncE
MVARRTIERRTHLKSAKRLASLAGYAAALLLSGTVAPPSQAQFRGSLPFVPAYSGVIPTSTPFRTFAPLATFTVEGEVAEIAAVTPDGRTVLYTDSASKEVGFVDIRNVNAPKQLGTVGVDGEPTSVAVTPDGRFALVCVRDPNQLVVINLRTRTVARQFDLGGQPDSVAISPNGVYAAIAIENERSDEDEELPVSPPGFVTIVDLGRRISRPLFPGVFLGRPLPPTFWTLRNVSLLNVADRFPSDPEPEYVAINRFDQLAVTLQENNFIVTIDLPTGAVTNAFSAGMTTHLADLQEDDEISFSDTLLDARLEPDAIAWTLQGQLVTANEGDYDLDLLDGSFVGGRNFTVFNPSGSLLFDSGATLEAAAAAANLYPDDRSENRGSEPEGVAIAFYGRNQYGFIGTERGNFVAVYDFNNPASPRLLQILATGSRPEGLLPVPKRNLFITANEGDGTLSIFRLN